MFRPLSAILRQLSNTQLNLTLTMTQMQLSNSKRTFIPTGHSEIRQIQNVNIYADYTKVRTKALIPHEEDRASKHNDHVIKNVSY
jgi:Mor family transcriptional regulator